MNLQPQHERAFQKILSRVQQMFPGSFPVIGGGALRDSIHGREIKDVDVFLRWSDHSTLKHPLTTSCIPPEVSYCVGRADLHGVWNLNHPLYGFDVQLILAEFRTRVDLAASFDIGLSRITFDGFFLHISEDFYQDSEDKVFRICRAGDEKEEVRSQKRITRLLHKYPDFRRAS